MIADTARIHQARVHWLAEDDELLEQLRLLGGHDDDLAHDRTRVANRLRDLLLQTNPGVERVLGPRLEHPAVRALLHRYPTPSAMSAAGKRRLLRLVEPKAPRMGARLVEELLAALQAQTVTVTAEATLGRIIRELAGELTRLAAAHEQLAEARTPYRSPHPAERTCAYAQPPARAPAAATNAARHRGRAQRGSTTRSEPCPQSPAHVTTHCDCSSTRCPGSRSDGGSAGCAATASR